MNLHPAALRRRTAAAIALGFTIALAPAFSLAGPVAPAAQAAPASCAAEWGSLVKRSPDYTSKKIVDVRSGRHQCFDRLVVDINSRGRGEPGYQVKYVKRVRMDGSGTLVPLRGGEKIRIIVKAPAYNDRGRLTYRPANRKELVDVAGYRTFRQVAWAGTFEGQTTIGLGVRARLPMRVFVLPREGGGHRVVIDVAHRWPQSG